MPHYYANEAQANDKYALPTILVTQFTRDELQEYFNAQTEWTGYPAEDADDAEGTWMVCYCLPGCLPDSEWYGPFATMEEARAQGVEYFAE